MKDIIDRYIRSLAEREHPKDGPETRQDLGTFVGWLLERHGYRILLHALKREGLQHVKSAGRRQWGVDLIATKPDSDGEDRIYRFVLKCGDIGVAQWQPATEGSMPHDLGLAVGTDVVADALNDPGSSRPSTERVTVVAVHNGALDSSLLSQVDVLLRKLQKGYGVETDWWDADRLVTLALGPPNDGSELSLTRQADAALFPPSVRPFVRLALDSLLRVEDGGGFDLWAVDRLIDETLPNPVESGRSYAGYTSDALYLHRKLAELSLLVEMVRIESTRVARQISFPVLDTLERVLCRAVVWQSRLAAGQQPKRLKKVHEVMGVLVSQYVESALALSDRLQPLLEREAGLALNSASEVVDYPVRVLRISGYLATAGLAAIDSKQNADAERLANTLAKLWETNPAAVRHPVTDDQIIETSLTWMLWLRLDWADRTAHTAYQLLERMMFRRQFGFVLPALYQRARVPFRSDGPDARVLASAYFEKRADVPGFVDGGSAILPLAAYLAFRGGKISGDDWTAVFSEGRTVGGDGEVTSSPRIYAQSWQPPEDADDEWYLGEIVLRGHTRIFDLNNGTKTLVDEFESAASPLRQTAAQRQGFPAVDYMAWKRWRTPPPMWSLVELARRAFSASEPGGV